MTSTPTPIQSLDSTEVHLTPLSPLVDDIFQLVSSDGQGFIIPKQYAILSLLVKSALDKDQNELYLKLPSVHSNELKHIVQYLVQKDGDTKVAVRKPLQENMVKSCITECKWEADFIDNIASESLHNLRELTQAANYMDIHSLLHLCCSKVALVLKGKTSQQMKEMMSKF